MNITFGPVPSRRLGCSLGINHIPPKHCSYSCRYCQVGATLQPEIVRHAFHTPQAVVRAVTQHLEQLTERDKSVDYLTFVPDGEPSLDKNLGQLIDSLRPFKLPIAVISNASLIWREDVRADLVRADWVSLKVDSVNPAIWRHLNQPHTKLHLTAILDGICAFAADFHGTLCSETMLVAGVNDSAASVEAVARFLEHAGISLAYLAIPHRPPADANIRAPDETVVTRAWHSMTQRLQRVELLTAYEGDNFTPLNDPRSQLLAITAVHPMRESAVRALLAKSNAEMTLVTELMAEDLLHQVHHAGETFYLRRLPRA